MPYTPLKNTGSDAQSMIARPRYPKLTQAVMDWVVDNKKHVPAEDQNMIFQRVLGLQPYQVLGWAARDSRGRIVALDAPGPDGKFLTEAKIGDSFFGSRLEQPLKPGDLLPDPDAEGIELVERKDKGLDPQ